MEMLLCAVLIVLKYIPGWFVFPLSGSPRIIPAVSRPSARAGAPRFSSIITVVVFLGSCLTVNPVFADEIKLTPDKKNLSEIGLVSAEAQTRQMNIQQKMDFQNALERLNVAVEKLKLREKLPKIGLSVSETEVRLASLIAGMNNIKNGKKIIGIAVPGKNVLVTGNISVMEFYDENGVPVLQRRQKLTPTIDEAPDEWVRLGEQKETLLARGASAREIQEASEVLGQKVASGRMVLPDRNLSRVYVITKFFDRQERFIGQHSVNASMTSAGTRPDAWYLMEEKGDLAFLR